MINLKDYEFSHTKTTTPDTEVFNLFARIQDEMEQFDELLLEEDLDGGDYIGFMPHKRKKFSCPTKCGNTYVWLEDVYESADKQKLVCAVTCARCSERFLIYYKRKKNGTT